MPQERVEIKKWKTGIFVKVHGTSPKKIIGYRADIDGLPIDEETDLAFKSQHETEMHACGHDFHMTIALGVLTHLFKIQSKMISYLFSSLQRKDQAGQNPCLKAK